MLGWLLASLGSTELKRAIVYLGFLGEKVIGMSLYLLVEVDGRGELKLFSWESRKSSASVQLKLFGACASSSRNFSGERQRSSSSSILKQNFILLIVLFCLVSAGVMW